MEANEISRKLLNTEYVYCLSNSSFSSDVLKVGWTRHNPAYRANQLYTTGLPTPFKIEFLILTQHGRSLEGRIHDHLSRCRVNGSREFFNISISELREVLTNKFSLTLIELSDIIDYLPKQDNTSRRKKKQTSLYKPITPIHSNVEDDPLVDSREVDIYLTSSVIDLLHPIPHQRMLVGLIGSYTDLLHPIPHQILLVGLIGSCIDQRLRSLVVCLRSTCIE